MVMKSFLRASRVMQTASFALAIACGAAVTMPSSVLAGSGEPGEVTMRLRNALMDVQYGRAEDTHGWMHPVA